MGTRNLTCLIKDGKFRIAQYGQWDGYPDCAGSHILSFLSNPGNIESLTAALDRVSFLPEGELDRRLEAEGMQSIQCGSEQETRYRDIFRWFDRDLGYKIFDAIILSDENKIELEDSSSFACDSLFCEWAYVVDLDRNLFEVYKGCNKDPHASNGVFGNVQNRDNSREYYKVVLVRAYSLDRLPTSEVLVEECDPPEED